MYLRYKLDYHWTFSLYGSLKRSAEDFSDLYPGLYQTDYRTWRDGNGLFPTSLTQTYNLYGEYKNTVQEFFITAALTYSRSNRNTLSNRVFPKMPLSTLVVNYRTITIAGISAVLSPKVYTTGI